MDTRYLINALLDDSWIVAVQDEIDALPDTLADVATPYTVGCDDAAAGRPCEPLQHYARLGDIEQYIIGFKEETARLDERGDAIEDDADWIRGGC